MASELKPIMSSLNAAASSLSPQSQARSAKRRSSKETTSPSDSPRGMNTNSSCSSLTPLKKEEASGNFGFHGKQEEAAFTTAARNSSKTTPVVGSKGVVRRLETSAPIAAEKQKQAPAAGTG